jgi:hypothetical protein
MQGRKPVLENEGNEEQESKRDPAPGLKFNVCVSTNQVPLHEEKPTASTLHACGKGRTLQAETLKAVL